MNRREFVRLNGLGMASLLLAGCGIFAPKEAKTLTKAGIMH